MADAPTAPTQEQLDQVKAANDAEMARWEGDFKDEDLVIPYKKVDDTVEDEDKDDNKKPDDDSDKQPEEPIVTQNAPDPVVTAEDPGDYKPADYSFEVVLKGGKTTKITTPEEADKLAEDPENFETPKQLLDFIRRSQKMESQLDKDKEKWESKKEAFDEQSKSVEQQAEYITTVASEFDYLVSKGLLPKIAKEYVDADWSDPEVIKQPGVKEQVELLNYMVKENDVRSKAKVKPMTSIVDAFNAWQLDTGRQKQEIEQKKAGEKRKEAGARVAGTSPAQQGSYVPKGIAVGRVIPKRGAAMWDN